MHCIRPFLLSGRDGIGPGAELAATFPTQRRIAADPDTASLGAMNRPDLAMINY